MDSLANLKRNSLEEDDYEFADVEPAPTSMTTAPLQMVAADLSPLMRSTLSNDFPYMSVVTHQKLELQVANYAEAEALAEGPLQRETDTLHTMKFTVPSTTRKKFKGYVVSIPKKAMMKPISDPKPLRAYGTCTCEGYKLLGKEDPKERVCMHIGAVFIRSRAIHGHVPEMPMLCDQVKKPPSTRIAALTDGSPGTQPGNSRPLGPNAGVAPVLPIASLQSMPLLETPLALTDEMSKSGVEENQDDRLRREKDVCHSNENEPEARPKPRMTRDVFDEFFEDGKWNADRKSMGHWRAFLKDFDQLSPIRSADPPRAWWRRHSEEFYGRRGHADDGLLDALPSDKPCCDDWLHVER